MPDSFFDKFPGRWTLLIIAGLMVFFSAIPLVNGLISSGPNMDYTLWQKTGNLLLDGAEIYPRDGKKFPFMYPPPCATMLAPISRLPEVVFVFLLTALNSLAWAACILLSVYLVTGSFRSPHLSLYFWPSIAVIPLVHNTYTLGQPAILLLALLLGCFALIRTGRPFAGGALLAIAVAIKAYPLIAAGYFVYQRKWKAMAGLVAGLVVLFFVLPLIFRTPAQVRDDAVVWTQGMLFRFDSDTIAQRPKRSYSFKNQSLQATVHRLFRSVPADGEAKDGWTVNVVDLGFRGANILMMVAVAALVVFYAVSAWRAPPQGTAASLDEGMVSLIVVFLAPLSFQYSYVWLIFPLTALLYLGVSSPMGSRLRSMAWWGIGGCVGLLALSIPAARLSNAYANVFLSGLVVFVVLGLILRSGWIKSGNAHSGISQT